MRLSIRDLRRRADTQGGTTLIELVIVIAIIGILALMTVPNLESWIYRMRLNSAASRTVSLVKTARKLALSEDTRYCVTFAGDSGYNDGNDSSYNITATILREQTRNSGVFVAMTQPVELAGFTNDATTELFKGVSLEPASAGTTTTVTGVTGCAGLVFNNQGFLANPTADFPTACGGATCAALTLRVKGIVPLQQRTIWVNRGGSTQITGDPGTPPSAL